VATLPYPPGVRQCRIAAEAAAQWGCRPKKIDLSAKLITDWNDFEYGDDPQFLSQHIHPIIKDDVLIHSDFSAYDDEIVTPFHTPRERLEWVGMPALRTRALEE
jgi:hypothetical protein